METIRFNCLFSNEFQLKANRAKKQKKRIQNWNLPISQIAHTTSEKQVIKRKICITKYKYKRN